MCLRPQITFVVDKSPTDKQVEEMHQAAHHSCFLASSAKTEIVVEAIAP
ncbi:MAG: hypothetical protein H0X31_06300 [Nostocaceae cyanobacterium]|nr:hypothetical protein [Nostocaceae cyanobacterium]